MSDNNRTKCTALDRNGQPCAFFAWRTSCWCVSHAAARGDPDAQIELKRRAAVGRAKANANRSTRRVVKLRAPADLLTELERALSAVLNSAAAPVDRAGAVVRIVSEARAILNAEKLERENAELRQLLVEKFPDLRRKLKVLP